MQSAELCVQFKPFLKISCHWLITVQLSENFLTELSFQRQVLLTWKSDTSSVGAVQSPRKGVKYCCKHAFKSLRGCLPIRCYILAVRQNFPSQWPSSLQFRRSQNFTESVDNRPFLCDLILLSAPGDSRATSRCLIYFDGRWSGHIVIACQFTKGLSAVLVETTIIEAFEGKILPDIDSYQFGQMLDGIIAVAYV